MTIFVLENVSPGFRGELTKWLLEVKAGVFIGNISASIRSRLWERIKKQAEMGAGLCIYSAQTEQGFMMEMCNAPQRKVVDLDGLYLIGRTVSDECT